MSDSQFRQYNNVRLFAEKWRKYKPTDKPHTHESFRKEMQPNKYIKLEYINSASGRRVVIYLFTSDSKYAAASQDLKRLLNKNKDPCDVILITEKPFKVYANKVIYSLKHLNIKSYLHKIFESETPTGPLCYPHRIMSKEEVNLLLNNDLCCNLTNLPKILEEDPQCVWIGAMVADVIEINMASDISGETIRYCVVVPKSGKITSFRKDDAVPVEEVEDEDEEIKEYRETAKNELSDYEDEDEDEEPPAVED
jgi:hypothetical protein